MRKYKRKNPSYPLCVTEGCSNTCRTAQDNKSCGHTCSPCDKALRLYGMTTVDRNNMLADQDGLCKICEEPVIFVKNTWGKKNSAGIDHCHDTGKIRGILCGRCNLGLGYFNDDKLLLGKAIEYLEEAK